MIVATLQRIYERYAAADAGLLAAAIAYNAFFALFPIILFILSVIGFVLRDPVLLSQAEDFIIGSLPPTIAPEVAEAVRGTSQAAGIFCVISLLGFLWAGSALFGTLAKAFDRVYDVPSRSMVWTRLMGFGMIFLFAALLVLAVSASVIAQFAVDLVDLVAGGALPGLDLLAVAVSSLVSFGAGLLLFVSVLTIVPNAPLRPRDTWIGALLGAVLFFLVLQLFPLYVRFAAGVNRYGALFGFLFLMLTWLYFSSQVFLIGAAVNAAISPHRASASGKPEADDQRR